jgi:hypothetical protein
LNTGGSEFLDVPMDTNSLAQQKIKKKIPSHTFVKIVWRYLIGKGGIIA